MQQTWILYPMFAMVLLSMLVGLRMLQLRQHAVLHGNLPPAYFMLNRGGKPPVAMIQADQHFTNLYETPVLFYSIVIVIFALNMTDTINVIMAWAYIATRLGHALVHMGDNKIRQRRNIFLGSISLIAALWSYTFAELLLA